MTPEQIHRANIAYLCNPADVADLVARHDALRRETEALRAELNRAQQEARRTAKTLIAGQAALQAERDAAREERDEGWRGVADLCDVVEAQGAFIAFAKRIVAKRRAYIRRLHTALRDRESDLAFEYAGRERAQAALRDVAAYLGSPAEHPADDSGMRELAQRVQEAL